MSTKDNLGEGNALDTKEGAVGVGVVPAASAFVNKPSEDKMFFMVLVFDSAVKTLASGACIFCSPAEEGKKEMSKFFSGAVL